MPPRRQAAIGLPFAAAFWLLASAVLGCASPGPPRSPSLQIPTSPTGLSAARAAETVTITLSALERSTDRTPLRSDTYRGVLCRSVAAGPCVALSSIQATVTAAPANPARQARRTATDRPTLSFTDHLPPELASGPLRLLAYRVEFFSPAGASAGKSDPAFAVAGAAPSQVRGLRATGSRAGALLTWTEPVASLRGSTSGDVILSREDLSPAPATRPRQPATLWFNANSTPAPETGLAVTVDATLKPGVPYRYRATRVRRVTLAGHPLELRSEPSSPVDLTLAQTFPPATPTGLTAAPAATAAGFAVDLIWQPIDDPGPATHVAPPFAGYNIYRQTLAAQAGSRERLNSAPLTGPAFHDATALPTQRYRYAVSAVDAAGNESPATVITLDPQS